MDLKDIELFLAVVQEGSFTRAAHQHFIAQPTLSKAIKRLEQALNVQLLHRTTRQIQVTDSGKVVYEYGRKLLDTMTDLEQSIQDLREVKSGVIRLGIPPLIGTLFFPEIAQKFHQKYPHITLELVEHGAKTIHELVRSGNVDAGFAVLPLEASYFSVMPFIKDYFVAYVHVEHPFATQSQIAINDLKNEPFILFSEDFALHDFVIRACENEGFTPRVMYKSSQWDLIVELVGLQLGVTILPRAIYEKQANTNVKIIPLDEPLMWQLGIVSLNERYQTFALQEWLKLMQEEWFSWHEFMPIGNK